MVAAASWTWHVCLRRSHARFKVSSSSSDEDGIKFFEGDSGNANDNNNNKSSTGWLLEVYRLKDDDIQETDKILAPQVVEAWMKEESLDARKLLSLEPSSSDKEEDQKKNDDDDKQLLQNFSECPEDALILVSNAKRRILSWVLLDDRQGFPERIVDDALGVLKNAETDFKPDYLPHDDENDGEVIDTLMVRTFSCLSKDTWKQVVSESPSAIHLYLPPAIFSKNRKRYEKAAKEIFPAAAIHTEKGPIWDLSSEVKATEEPCYGRKATPEEVARVKRKNLVHRLLFNLNLSPCLVLLGNRFEGMKEQEVAGYRGMRAIEYITKGTPLAHLPQHNRPFESNDGEEDDSGTANNENLRFDNEFSRYSSVYRIAGQLLCLRPWKIFAPFEALKVTWKRHMFADEVVRIIHFCSHESHDGDTKSNSPLGWMEIWDDEREFHNRFGRTNMFIQAGILQTEIPDRVLVSAECTSNVHYDSILLLEHLFEGALHCPVVELPVGLTTVLQAETGPPDGYPRDGRPKGVRPLTNTEMDWVERCVPAIYRFVTEEGERCKPNDGMVVRSYSTRWSSRETVTISYNMDIHHGGLWDPERKWMWFS